MKCWPPSVNHTYMAGRRGMRFKSREAVSFEKAVAVHLWGKKLVVGPIARLRVEIKLVSPNWVTKKKTISKIDLDNRLKAVLDAVFKKLGVDDRQVFEIEARKVEGSEKWCGIKIYEILGTSLPRAI